MIGKTREENKPSNMFLHNIYYILYTGAPQAKKNFGFTIYIYYINPTLPYPRLRKQLGPTLRKLLAPSAELGFLKVGPPPVA